jgi:hypothetical protein
MNDDKKAEKIGRLHEALTIVADARAMASTHVWDQAFAMFERELLDRMLACGPDDDVNRYRLTVGIDAARSAKRAIEHVIQTEAGLLKELDILEGRLKRPQDITR